MDIFKGPTTIIQEEREISLIMDNMSSANNDKNDYSSDWDLLIILGLSIQIHRRSVLLGRNNHNAVLII